jgi:hypothetical protein
VAFDADLAGRVDDALAGQTGIVKQQMFGVVCYMRDGNAFAGVWNDSLVVRTGPDAYRSALREPFVREFDITGKSMTGWVVVGPEAIDDDPNLQSWLFRAMDFASTLAKQTKRRRRPQSKERQ